MSDNVQRSSVMIADDSRTVRAALNLILRSNYDVIQAEDGEDCWEKLTQNPGVSMLITDIMMPKLDGYGLICRIRASDNAAIRDLPVVVITSAEDAITRERAHACGANDFIVKPVESSDLLERVNFHTEAKLGRAGSAPQKIQEFEEIETTVIEAPDINSALEIIRGAKIGSVDPYAIDLCIEVMPLLEYCDTTFGLDLFDEIEKIKSKLNKF
jgi:CheY-like chemotaxis protein